MTSTEHHPTTSLSAALAVVREEKAKLSAPIDWAPIEGDDSTEFKNGFREGLDQGTEAMARIEEFITDLGHQIDALVAEYTA